MISRSSSRSSLIAASSAARDSPARTADSGDGAASPGRRSSAARRARPVAPPGRPPSVAGLVGDDPQDPRPERRVRPEPRQRGVGLDERVLDGVLGVAVGRDEVGRPDRDVLVASDQLFVGHDLAFPRADDQLGIFQWTALHLITVADTPTSPGEGSPAGARRSRRRAAPEGTAPASLAAAGCYFSLKSAEYTGRPRT